MHRKRPRRNRREARAIAGIYAALARVSTLTWPHARRFDVAEIQRRITAGEHGASRSCEGKAKFARYDTAERARVDLEARHGKPLETYACAFCSSFHLSTRYRPADPPPVTPPADYKFPTLFPHRVENVKH